MLSDLSDLFVTYLNALATIDSTDPLPITPATFEVTPFCEKKSQYYSVVAEPPFTHRTRVSTKLFRLQTRVRLLC